MATPGASPATSSGLYVVHAVDNADRITLCVPNKMPPELKNVVLTGIIAPKIARVGNQGDLIPDEPCANDAREFVRRMIIGKTVKFQFDTNIEALARDSGRISTQDGQDVAVSLCRNGLADVQERQGRGPKDFMEKVFNAVKEAMSQGIGIWSANKKDKVRVLAGAPPEDPDTLLKVMKGEIQKVLVEKVISGSTLLVTLLSFGQQCNVNLTGVISPSVKGTPEPFALEAKFHTERALLHREINMEFDAVGTYKNFLGSVVSGSNVFQMDLLQRGFAKTMVSTLAYTTYKDRMKAAEKAAQEKKVGVWKDYVPPQILNAEDPVAAKEKERLEWQGEKQFSAEVISILSGDTLLLYVKGQRPLKVSLASVRANRIITRDQEPGKEARVSYECHTWECREALRLLTIGKSVEVSVDYVRMIEETKELRPYVTLVLSDTGANVAAFLIGQGLAKAQIHQREVACCADLLRDAEASAKARKLGIHGKEPAPTRLVELARPGEKKARQYLAYFQRGGPGGRPPRLPAIVDMVLAPTSLKVYIPKETTQITLKLAGITSPSMGMNDEPSDPFAEEAKLFATRALQSRDVEIEVETVDKYGNFLGTCYINNQNFSLTLIKAGLGCVGNVDRLSYASDLKAAEKKAQEARLNIWGEGGNVPAKVQKAQDRAVKIATGSLQDIRTESFDPVMLMEIASSTSVFVCQLDAATKATRKKVEGILDEYRDTGVKYFPSKKEEIVVCRFSEDGRWYRGKVSEFSKDKKGLATIRFIDFGNFEERCSDDIRANDDATLRDTPPLATMCGLAYLRSLPADFADLATESLRSYCSVPSLYARPEYRSNGVSYYTISSDPSAETAAQSLVRQGLGIVDERLPQLSAATMATRKDLVTLQATCQKSGRNVWQYGTAIADDDDD